MAAVVWNSSQWLTGSRSDSFQSNATTASLKTDADSRQQDLQNLPRQVGSSSLINSNRVPLPSPGAKGEAASGNVTLGAPPDPQPNDMWIAVVHSTDNVTHSFTDWTQIANANGGGALSHLSVWWHRYDGVTIPNLTVTHSSGNAIVGGIAAYRGVRSTGSPIDTTGTIVTSTDQTIGFPSITPTENNCIILLAGGHSEDDQAFSEAGITGGFTRAFSSSVLGTALGSTGAATIYNRVQTTAAATNAQALIFTPSAHSAGLQIALKTSEVAADQTITPSLYTETDETYAPSVNHVVLPGLFTDTDNTYAPTILVGGVTLTPGLFTDTDTPYVPSISGDGAVQGIYFGGRYFGARYYGRRYWSARPSTILTIAPSLFTDTDNFYAPTLTYAQVITPSILTDTDEFYAPVVFFAQVLTPSRLTETDELYTPAINLILVASLFTDTDEFYAPTVNPAQFVSTALFTDTDEFYAPNFSLAIGISSYFGKRYFGPRYFGQRYWSARGASAVTIQPAIFADTDTLYTPAVVYAQVITPNLVTDNDVFYAPSVTGLVISPALFIDNDVFYAPQINIILTPSLFTDTDNFYAPALHFTISPSLFTDNDTFYAPTINLGQTVTVNLLTDNDVFYAPANFSQALIVVANLLTDNDVLYTPSILVAGVTITPEILTEVPGNTGLIVAGTGTAIAGSGADWTGAGNITADDGTNATVSVPLINVSDYIKASVFGISGIPSYATITAIEVTAQVSATVNHLAQLFFQVGKSDASLSTDFSAPVSITTTPTNFSLTAASLWGLSWTLAEVMASTFQVRMSIFNNTISTRNYSVDAIWVKVSYTVPNAETAYAPQINLTVFPGLFTDNDVFYAPAVTAAIAPSILTDTDVFYAPNIAQQIIISPALFTDADTLYDPYIFISQNITPALYTETDIVYNPTLSVTLIGRRQFSPLDYSGLS